MKINKNDIIKEISTKMNMPVHPIKEIINCAIDSIEKHVLNGDDVSIKGLVHFSQKEYSSKEVQNFSTGEREKVEPRVMPYCKISKAIIDKYKEK